jgi:putative peptidoglycan lipid II flippase
MSDVKRGLVKPTIQITTLAFVSIILSFASQLVVAYFFGATSERDAYFAALVIPTYVSAVLTGSIGVMFLPMYVDIKAKESKNEANRFLSHTVSFAVLIALVIVVLGTLFSREIVSATVPGFENKQASLTSELLIILLPTIAFQIATSLVGSVLQVQHRFILPALLPVLSALINLVAVVAFNRFIGIKGLAYGTLVAAIITFCILVINLGKDIQLKFSFRFKHKNLFKLISVCVPLIIGAVIGRVSEIFERSLASNLEAGSISYLGYAKQLLIILTTIATTGLATSIFPTISKAWSDGNITAVRHYFIKCVQIIFLITIPIAAIFTVLGEPIISVVFERGAFNHTTAVNVSRALAILMGCFLAMSFGSILSKIIYFTQQTYYGLLVALVEATMYIVSGYYFIKLFSFLGLAIASTISTSTSIIACLAVLLYSKILTRKELSKIVTLAFLNIIIVFPLSVLLYFAYHILIRYCNGFLATGVSISLFLFLLVTIYSLVFAEVRQANQMCLQWLFRLRSKSYA